MFYSEAHNHAFPLNNLFIECFYALKLFVYINPMKKNILGGKDM